jgi:hypothetical protein
MALIPPFNVTFPMLNHENARAAAAKSFLDRLPKNAMFTVLLMIKCVSEVGACPVIVANTHVFGTY